MVSQDVAYQVAIVAVEQMQNVHCLSFFFLDLCHMLHVLCATAGHTVPVLEDLSDCPQTYTAPHSEVLQCDVDGDGGELLTGSAHN